jgi:hypothetical protein
MTVLAPKASALTMCPEFWMPPSAMTGTPSAFASLRGRGGQGRVCQLNGIEMRLGESGAVSICA